ncbi:hypothetical protein QR90_03400 [Deinococcus radiopugnans]|uniref:Tetratricopeptide repeat-containing protein n=2 Tax=Deinococcus radiopugnans TaxID=57497 RepID=A0A0A7KII1_9DEIO|nr:hypothetical protein [Deinococcus radiopugnans]AIZ44353.1 hypothetical protein QR90_03400 [Deinococcus radiopugnans]MBB6017524.1 hypothetical protein [Deinococcus radiopugnans ATCC 19172]QLG09940.1 hypothetical protein HLB42_03525 [Deinococcus sp. D7000]TNM69779.1 hypothetical protein FHR04_14455 [Deinococcus radiopugnans ATCC 19172]
MRTPMLIAALTAALVTTASAQSQAAAQALYDSGKWQEAALAAAALNTSAGLALAAEATTAGAGLVADAQKKALFQKAQDYAKSAIAKDKNNADAYFELARAQGRLAQFSGILQSLGLAGDMKKNLDQAIKLDPKLAGAYVALGLWHANLDEKGFIARRATGADKNQIAPNFEKAFALEPNVAVHHIEYANALILQKRKAEAAAELQKAIALPAETFWQKRDLEAARKTLASLK